MPLQKTQSGSASTTRTTVANASIHEFATNNTPNNYFDPNNSFHLIVSNPPYIPTSQMLGLDPVVSRHEDPRALDGGLDGMDVIRQIIQFAPYLAAPGAHMWFEVDASHPELLAREAPIGSAVELIASFTDMAKHPRFVQLRVHGIRRVNSSEKKRKLVINYYYGKQVVKLVINY